jgi:hypothetical protein
MDEKRNQDDGIDHADTVGNAPSDEPKQTPAEDAMAVDVPPDGGYGWVCVACVFLINAQYVCFFCPSCI